MLTLALLCLWIGARPDSVSAQDDAITISDGDFNAQDWSTITVDATFGATATATQITTGGNPGSYRAITHTLPTPPDLQLTQLTVAHLYTATLYNPATQGAITTVDFQQDARLLNLPWDQAFTTTQVALRQGGRLFSSERFVRTIATLAWEPSALTALAQEDFVAADGSGDHPDFSATGAAIAFGFVRLNSRLAASPPVPPGDLVYAHAIDNWTVTVHRAAQTADLLLAPASPQQKFYVNYETSLDFFFLGTPGHGVTVTNRGPATAISPTIELLFAMPAFYAQPNTVSSRPCGADGVNCRLDDLAPGASATVSAHRVYAPPRGRGAYHGPARFEARVRAVTADPTTADTLYSSSYELFFCDDVDSFVCPIQTLFCLENFEDLGQTTVQHRTPTTSTVQIKTAAEIVIDLPLYYPLRDGVLLPRVNGQRLAARYATHGPEITALLVASDTLRAEAINTATLWEPNLRALVNGDGTPTISQAQVDALDSLLTDLAAVGSAPLQQAIADELTTLGDLDAYVGMSMAAAEAAVLGEVMAPDATVYLPLINGQ